jgi:hypothetical protein
MSKHDLQARPVYHRKRDSIKAHLTVVFAALAVSRWIEAQTGSSIRKFVKTARRYRTIEIQAGRQTITAANPLPTTYAKPSKPSPTAAEVRTHMKRDVKALQILCLTCGGLLGCVVWLGGERGRAFLVPCPG